MFYVCFIAVQHLPEYDPDRPTYVGVMNSCVQIYNTNISAFLYSIVWIVSHYVFWVVRYRVVEDVSVGSLPGILKQYSSLRNLQFFPFYKALETEGQAADLFFQTICTSFNVRFILLSL